MQMYPGWSARDNYAQSKKKKRKRESETSKSDFRDNFSRSNVWYLTFNQGNHAM